MIDRRRNERSEREKNHPCWPFRGDCVSINPMQEPYAVLIVSHNSAETLAACLTAVSLLDPPPSETLIIDNASSDDSPTIARSFGLPLKILEENTGFTGGMNTGLKILKSTWALLLNPDCALSEDFVSRLMESIERQDDSERIGSATGLLMRAAGPELDATEMIDSAGMVVTPSGRHFDRGTGMKYKKEFTRPAWVFGGTGAATLYRRAALEDVAFADGSVFAPSFFAYREDAELAWRLQWRGWRCLFEPSARAAHRRGLRPETGRAKSKSINYHSVRNRYLMRIHCADIGWHLRCFPDWILRDLLVLAACGSIEISSLPALIEIFKLRRDALSRRRWVLSRRKVESRRISSWFRRPGGWVEEITTR